MTSTMPRVRQCIAMLNKRSRQGRPFSACRRRIRHASAYQMDNRQHALHSPDAPEIGPNSLPQKKFLTERSYRQIPPKRKTTTGGMNRAPWLVSVRQNHARRSVFLDISEEIAKIGRFEGGQILWRPGVSSKATRLISR